GQGALGGHRGVRHGRARGDPQRRDRDPAQPPRADAGAGAAGEGSTGGPDGEDGMARNVVTPHFLRRRVVLTVASNLVRYLFGGAARHWARNVGRPGPALVSMTVLVMM